MSDEIHERIHRIYAAIGAIEESNPDKLRATILQSEKATLVIQDFRGGYSDAELVNQATMLIYNIANLESHLRQWAKTSGVDKNEITKVVDGCRELKIMVDLSNNDRHPYPPRDGGRSGVSPKLIDIHRPMRLGLNSGPSTIAMTIGRDGRPKFTGDGTAKAIVTGDIVDDKSNRIGDFYETAMVAVKAWEDFAQSHGLTQSGESESSGS